MTRADVIVVGAGAAGMLAATRAAERGKHVILLEKNRKAGVKILMSGGTRCNLTHACDRRGIADAFGKQGRFLHSPLAAMGPEQVVDLFNANGVATKVEATGKVFPQSDRAIDVQRAMLRMLGAAGVDLHLAEPVEAIERSDDADVGFLIRTSRNAYRTSAVIITSGGQSYPGCGTTGDGYAWAKGLGHRIVPTRPALTPLLSDAAWVRELQGVTLPDTQVAIGIAGAKPASRQRGPLLLTHFGLSGPVAMDLSRIVTERPDADRWVATCDFAPDRSEESLQDELASGGSKQVATIVNKLAPQRLADALLAAARTPGDRRLAELAKPERRRVIDALKRRQIPITGTQGFKKAEVTAGGVDLRDVDSRTMQSRHTPGLYFAGEVLDLDGPIGGYNFQAAFSTGWLAGESV
ncbi:MAG: NAD(P)/FAD-dependent oxidoreductase [Planctomycetota bacterium]